MAKVGVEGLHYTTVVG